MRSKYFLGLLIAGAAAAATTGGCGPSTNENTGGSGGDDTSSSSKASSASSSSSAASSTGSGGAGVCPGDADKNCDAETAEAIEIDDAMPFEADLDPVDEDVDYYSFDGKKGQALYIYTNAKVGGDPFDKAYADLVITLYDENKVQIAENDDPVPRSSNDSSIYTILPSDGTFVIRVLECNKWEKGGPASCSAAGDINDSSYEIGILELDSALPSVTAETAPDNTEATPDTMKYQKGQTAGQYIISTVDGFYTDANDRDVYKFKLPTDYKLDANERVVGYFNLLPGGPTGNGSTASIGGASVVDPVDMTTVAEITSASEDMSPPLAADKEYLLFVDAPKTGGDFAGNPFYFVLHNGGGSNPVEAEKAPLANDTFATAETLTKAMSTTGSFFIEGDVSVAGTDVDWFSMTVPAATTQANAICGAQRSGSGLRGVKMTLLKQDGTTALKTGTETADKDLLFTDVDVTTGEKVFLKVEAGAQDPKVKSTFYRCGVHFHAVAN